MLPRVATRIRPNKQNCKGRDTMTFHERYLVGCAALAVAALVTASPTRAQAPTQPESAALNAEATQNDWPTYHGTYKSYHYSGLDQINAANVKNLEVAWMHFPERATRR